jgi:hypothetical protein
VVSALPAGPSARPSSRPSSRTEWSPTSAMLSQVFTVPKLLRPYFMHHRELLGPLCTAAWQTVRELMAVAAGEDQGLRPGMVAVVQTFGDQLNLHPHVHALVTRGGWTASGEWAPVPYVDPSSAEQLFRQKVIRLLQRAGLLDEDRTRLLLFLAPLRLLGPQLRDRASGRRPRPRGPRLRRPSPRPRPRSSPPPRPLLRRLLERRARQAEGPRPGSANRAARARAGQRRSAAAVPVSP